MNTTQFVIYGVGAIAALIAAAIIVLIVMNFAMSKDCDCAEEGADCVILGKPRGIKYMDANDPTKFKEKKFGIGGDYPVYPFSLNCGAGVFLEDPSPGNKKKCTLTRGKFDPC